MDKEKRKTLQVLQPAASGDGTLVGNRVVVRKNEKVYLISYVNADLQVVL